MDGQAELKLRQIWVAILNVLVVLRFFVSGSSLGEGPGLSLGEGPGFVSG